MISANDLRNVQIRSAENGYSVEEVNAVINEAATTIDAYANENKDLYHKLEVLAAKIEEYRAEEDSIKTALITAQKMADRIKKESNEEAEKLVAESKAQADTTLGDANAKADRIVSEAREYASSMIRQKTDEANAIVEEAEKKSNEAINSSKIVAQNILDQAKEISDDLISKSKEEKEAYELLNASLRRNAAVFIDNLKGLYSEQLDSLNGAKLFSADSEPDEAELHSIHSEVNSLVNEIGEMEKAIPNEITIEKAEYEAPAQAADEASAEETVEVTEEETPAIEEAPVPEEEEEVIEILDDDEDAADEEDVVAAVEAFSANEITPIDTSKKVIPEIEEEPEMEDKSLFEEKLPFENYFNVNKKDAHLDKTQTISLVPPEDDDEDDEPKFKGFFKKKK